MNHNEYSEKILKELSAKYDKEFEIVQLTYEVSGDGGNFYRAVCKAKDSETTFVACYYLNGTQYLLSSDETIQETKNEPILVDEYCSLLLNEKFIDYLLSRELGISHAVVDIATVKHALTFEDVSSGVEYCLSNNSFDVKVSAYVFISSDETDDTDFENKIINKFKGLNLYRCNLVIAYVSEGALPTVKDDYVNDIYMIEDKMRNDDRIVLYKRYSISEELGIELKEEIKGE